MERVRRLCMFTGIVLGIGSGLYAAREDDAAAYAAVEDSESVGERLKKAIEENDAFAVRQLLQEEPKALNRKCVEMECGDYPQLITPLSFAVHRGRADVVSVLLELGADVNKKGFLANTPLKSACIEALPSVVKMLLDAKADVVIDNDAGSEMLLSAIKGANSEIMQVILSNPCVCINKTPGDDLTALECASFITSRFGHQDSYDQECKREFVVKMLLAAGEDMDRKSDRRSVGFLALESAILYNHYGRARVLILAGAYPIIGSCEERRI